ncbi:sulfite exporter TauE/SafE family protein [Ferrimonas aestuarii]|uniref:Sulfite exporter TauE/SafE family protein n=1 Tax=Ferrimonas aestuarii TaxID=2569539 RepID=A0A4U1BRG9_9GAMM|nr:sulfite exporter TauE/SafE family protein [Ferrimonas aestuarii]TKB57444.1 sulfite exporter TauE/SafE family protein [Ferrimonas aestuarii]
MAVDFSAIAMGFGIGLLGAGHCLGMCGGVMAALSHGLPSHIQLNFGKRIALILGYNLGRLLSYCFAAAAVAFVVSQTTDFLALKHHFEFIRLFAGVVLVATGLYIGGLSRKLLVLEKIGQPVWKRLSPIAQKVMPIDTLTKAVVAGAIWGWLPCGLVYSTLIWTASIGDGTTAVLAMLAFGIGTLPALMVVGAAANGLKRWLNHRGFRLISSVIIVTYGFSIIYVSIGLLT